MMDKKFNMIPITFEDKNSIVVPARHQHDKGQILRFLDIPDGTHIEFGSENYDRAEPYIIQNSQVEIPDFLLEENSPIIAYVKVVNDNSETTIKTITIPVISRPMTDDAVPPENQQTFKQQVQEIMDSTKKIAQSVREDADSGKFNGEQGGIGPQGPPGEDYALTEADKTDISELAKSKVVEIIQPSIDKKVDKANWKLIRDITVEEELGAIEITKDEAGNAYEYDDIMVISSNVKGSNGANWWVSVRTTANTSSSGLVQVGNANSISSSTARIIQTKIERMFGLNRYEYESSYKNAGTYVSTVNKGTISTDFGLADNTKINYVRIHFSSNNSITDGKIIVYGRKRR